MATRRTIKITLTQPQIDALVSACALADSEYEGEEMPQWARAQAQARDNALRTLLRAWHERARPAKRARI